MAGTTGLEPATSAVTGQRSNQLSYVPKIVFSNLAGCHIESSASHLLLFSLVSYRFAGLDSISGHFGHQVDTNRPSQRLDKVYQNERRFGVQRRCHWQHFRTEPGAHELARSDNMRSYLDMLKADIQGLGTGPALAALFHAAGAEARMAGRFRSNGASAPSTPRALRRMSRLSQSRS
jgi:hypothetical protein